jgi:exodeoxyribonuclease VII small subunit
MVGSTRARPAVRSETMTTKTKKFEDELKELETIVSQIDSGELTLEESIGAFERGVMLVKALNGKLDEVERKVELLTRSAGGELRTAPFEPSSDNEDDNPAGAKDDDETPF